jgi:cell division protein FtsL
MRKKKRTKRTTTPDNATPQWFAFAVIVLLTFMICIAINIRAFSEMYEEMSQHSTLSTEIEKLKTENSELQKEVESLKTDEKTIEREARKIGLSRPE